MKPSFDASSDAIRRRAMLPLVSLLATGSIRRPLASHAQLTPCENPPCANPLPTVIRRVLDLQGYLSPAEEARLERILTKLEDDTGWKLRVLTQSKATAPELGPLLQWWQIGQGGRLRDPNAVVLVADRGLKGKLEAGGSFVRYETQAR